MPLLAAGTVGRATTMILGMPPHISLIFMVLPQINHENNKN
jgi:hypothetical protein